MRKLPPRLGNTGAYPDPDPIISIGYGKHWPHGMGVEREVKAGQNR